MRICWICILIIIGVDVSGQSYLTNTQHLTVEDGLSGRFAKDVQEDRQGFIWINTYNGLNRYDGFSFKFYSKPDYGFHLEDYEKLELDQAGRLWLIKLSLTEKGRSNELSQYIDVFDPSTEELMSEHVFSKAPFRIAEIKRIVAENQGGLWLQTVSGNFYRFDGNDFQLMFQRAKVDDFHLLSDGNLVAIDKTENKIIQVDKNGKFLQEWPLHQHFLLLAPDQHGGFIVGNILAKPNGKITQWRQYQAGQQIAVIQFTADLLPLSISGEQASFIYRLTQDDQQHWWLNDGLFLRVFSAKFNQIAAFPVENSSQNHLFTFFFDHYQNAWATSVDGVYIYQVKKNLFHHFLQVEEGFIDSRGIAELPDGKIVVNQNSTKIIDLEQGTIKEIGLGGTRGVLVDHNESLWLGKYAAGIIKYDIATQEWDTLPCQDVEPKDWNSITTNIFYQRKSDDTIFVGTIGRGLYTVDLEQLALIPYPVSEQFQGLRSAEIHSFYENNKGLWIGTDKGLFLLELEKGITKQVTFANEGTIPQLIYSIYEDTAGIFWLGTYNYGLLEWNPKTDKTHFYTTQNGLSDNTIYGIYEDAYNNLWMSSNIGLMRMNKQTKTVYTYFEDDGILHKEFNNTAHLQLKDKSLIFGGLKGYIIFHPKDFAHREKKDTMPVVLSEFVVIGDSTEQTSSFFMNSTKGGYIKIRRNQSAVRLALAAFNKISPDKSHFSWRKSTKDKWENISDNIIDVRRIPYGNNRISIRGQTLNGDLLIKPLEIVIYRQYPFYLSSYFLIPVLVLLMGLFYFLMKRRSQRQRDSLPSLDAQASIVEIEQRAVNRAFIEKKEEKPIYYPSLNLDDRSDGLPTAFEQWLIELNEKALKLIEEKKFSTVDLAEEMNMSDRQLRRKMKQNGYQTPAAYMREIRLLKAEQLLKSQTYNTVAEVCYAVGFSTPKHFSKLFQERFGQRPSSYQENIQKAEEEE